MNKENNYLERKLELDRKRNSLLASIDESLKVIANRENSFEELTEKEKEQKGYYDCPL